MFHSWLESGMLVVSYMHLLTYISDHVGRSFSSPLGLRRAFYHDGDMGTGPHQILTANLTLS